MTRIARRGRRLARELKADPALYVREERFERVEPDDPELAAWIAQHEERWRGHHDAAKEGERC